MNTEDRCPQCDAELPANAPRGLCPGCLLKGGLGTQTGGTGGSNPAQDADFVPPTPAELAADFPDLEILELIGRGGMGIVYKARQKKLDRLVALKILSPKIGQNPAFSDRFAREARAMAMLSHPHVVAVYDFGKTDRFYYFLMEFVDGLNLRQLMDAGRLAPEEALAIVPQVCDALQYAHNHGLVHRDIKPENILLDKEGQVKIADFGLAKLVGREVNDFTLTASGQLMGTPHYMAPEQFEHPKEVDHRADIYSLGVVFYQMLTGELPIGRFAAPSRKVQIDVRLDEVVLRALEKEPEQRYQQANEIKTEVETIATTPSPSGHNSTPERARGNEGDRSFFGVPLAERQNGVRQLVSWSGMAKAFAALVVLWLVVAGIRLLVVQNRVAQEPAGVVKSDVGLVAIAPEANSVGDAAAELRALQGRWKVVRVETGNNRAAAWGAICGFDSPLNPDTTSGFDFRELLQGGRLRIRRARPQHVESGWIPAGWTGIDENSGFAYRIDPTATHKTLDLFGVDPVSPGGRKQDEIAALGIYEIDGDRLRICLARYLPSVASDQRPRSFAIAPDSENILFVLERYWPSKDEVAMRGRWTIVSQSENGEPVWGQRNLTGTCDFDDDMIAVAETYPNGPSMLVSGVFFLDATKQPKRITIFGSTWETREDPNKGEELAGIYKFEGDRLTIAYRKGTKPPEKFESKPGSGVTLLVMRKAEKPKQSAPAFGMGGQGMVPGMGGPSAAGGAPPTVSQAGRAGGGAMPAVNAAAELKALQGPWNVVRVELGQAADDGWMQVIDLRKVDYVSFSERHLTLQAFVNRDNSTFEYGVNPTTEPKTIDVREQSSPYGVGEIVALGIYKIDDGKLTIRFTRYLPALQVQQRPKDFAIGPNTSDVLFVLERHRPSADEKALESASGTPWELVGAIDNGKETPPEQLDQACTLSDRTIFVGTYDSHTRANPFYLTGLFLLDPSKTPKTITMNATLSERRGDGHSEWSGRLSGIYKLSADRLTIAYRKGNKPPQKFESTPGSGVTLLVLQKARPAAKKP